MKLCVYPLQFIKLCLRKLWRKAIVIFTCFILLSITRDTQYNDNNDKINQYDLLLSRTRANLSIDAHIGIFNAEPVKEVPLVLFPEDSLATDRILEQLRYSPTPLNKTIYIYSKSFPKANTDYKEANCPIKNCVITSSEQYIQTADAVIFKGSFKQRKNTVNQDQIWIYYELESPMHTTSTKANSVNWTATYRWDSDLVAPYERFTLWEDVPFDQKGHQIQAKPDNYAAVKTKKAVWFASHCNTANRRDTYVKQLAAHISVDSYGTCGDRQGCPRSDKGCWNRLNSEYKFYLSFENSNCRDYITEKYFVNGLSYNVIPVVMGAPYNYYKKISPPHSFIHVDQFDSPEKLAQYLLYLDKNDTAYNEYFKWKGTGKFIHTKFWCRLCNLLNGPKPRKHYANLDEWWRGKDGSYCHNPGPWKNLAKDW